MHFFSLAQTEQDTLYRVSRMSIEYKGWMVYPPMMSNPVFLTFGSFQTLNRWTCESKLLAMPSNIFMIIPPSNRHPCVCLRNNLYTHILMYSHAHTHIHTHTHTHTHMYIYTNTRMEDVFRNHAEYLLVLSYSGCSESFVIKRERERERE